MYFCWLLQASSVSQQENQLVFFFGAEDSFHNFVILGPIYSGDMVTSDGSGE
jgi:hypothetical protein